MNKELNVYIGCGEDIREGFLHADIRKFDHVDFVCKAWELSFQLMETNNIYSSNLLEKLTNYEADRALRDWFKSLKTFGTIKMVLSNMDFYAKKWLEAQWTEKTLKNKKSDAQSSSQQFWGTQEFCDPWAENYSDKYISVNKSGYNKKKINLLLNRIGFQEIKIEIDKNKLIISAKKPKYSGERQVATELEKIRLDHKNRYIFANKFITKENAIVTDAACGVGYGSYIISKNKNVKNIQALDISKDALKHAKEHYYSEKIEHFIQNLEEDEFTTISPDYFVSFETIEHLPNPEKFIKKISEHLKKGATFIGSTPNEEIMPFIQQNFLFHTRHFTLDEIDQMLKKYGFNEIKYYQQNNDSESLIEENKRGQFIIFVAKK